MPQHDGTDIVSVQPHRATDGGLIDRERVLRFRFDNRDYEGYAGDTLASALLANGVRVVGRSFKYHRPRGVFGSGGEEPNALIQLARGARTEPNLRATQIELFDGLEASSQNRWPSLAFDVGGLNAMAHRFLPAGFYYKTFMWPPSAWMRYEHVIRNAAGLGKAPTEADPDNYAKRYEHCDVLVVGAGPSGLMAASTAAHSGARVVLVEEQSRAGGALCGAFDTVAGQAGHAWAEAVSNELASLPNVRVLPRAIAFGYYDQNLVAVNERVADHVARPAADLPRQRVWLIRAKEVVLATGAIERPLVFPGNDTPGVMLASAVGRYAAQYAVGAGQRAVMFTNNDSAYAQIASMHAAGMQVTDVIDVRANGPGAAAQVQLERCGAVLHSGYVVSGTRGYRGLRRVHAARLEGAALAGPRLDLNCDVLAVSGGWNPSVHLFSQSQGRLRYDEALTTFVPDTSRQRERSCGAARGLFDLSQCLTSGAEAGADAARSAGFTVGPLDLPEVAPAAPVAPIQPLWEVPRAHGDHSKCFVDLQNDVSADDVYLAARENYRSVEHLKRYTTLGMGTDQGRTSNVNGLAIMAAVLGRDIPEVGTTTFRPPFSPVTLGAVAGMEVGDELEPLRRTPLHDWHLQRGGVMQNVGLWQRCRYYPRGDESMSDAVYREALHVRNHVGIVDVSTFGKILIQGADAAQFLERMCVNRFENLRIDRCRYHVMLREDGFIMDDGTTTRISDNAFYMTTTTAAAGPVMAHMEFYAQTVWPELRVHLNSVSDQWGGLAIAGPAARDVLAAAVDDIDVDNASLAFMASREAHIGGVPVRVFRITFSGELGYEVHMPADYAVSVWERVMAAGAAHDVEVYGTEAMAVMRIEKGHVVHAELDGRTTLADFGFDAMVRKDTDFVGRRAMQREAFEPSTRARLVGLESLDGTSVPPGAQLVWNPTAPKPMHKYGHVSSVTYSPNLGKYIALALIHDAQDWMGKTLYAASPLAGRSTQVRIVPPVFIDPKGERARA